jgi:hypothetical protein
VIASTRADTQALSYCAIAIVLRQLYGANRYRLGRQLPTLARKSCCCEQQQQDDRLSASSGNAEAVDDCVGTQRE